MDVSLQDIKTYLNERNSACLKDIYIRRLKKCEAEMKKLSDYVKEQDQRKAIIKKYDRKSKEEFFNKFCIYVQKLMRGIIENLGAELIIKISRIVLASFGIII